MRFRQSELKQFGACARQYYYSSVLGLEPEAVGSLTVLGTVWHFAVEVYENYDHNLDLAKRTFLHYWENPALLGEKIDFWHRSTTYEGLQKRGLSMLEQYHELAPWQEGKLVGTEIHFVVPIGPYELEGTIDKLIARPGKRHLELIDFKTGANVPEKLRQNLQFTAYAYATMRPEFWPFVPGYPNGYVQFGDYRRVGWWYHARNNKMYSAGYRDKLDYQRLLLAMTEMENAIKAGVFPLDIKGETCAYCPFVGEVCGSEMPDPTP